MKMRLCQEFTLEFKDDFNQDIEIGESVKNGSFVISNPVMRIMDENGDEIDLEDMSDESLVKSIYDVLAMKG